MRGGRQRSRRSYRPEIPLSFLRPRHHGVSVIGQQQTTKNDTNLNRLFAIFNRAQGYFLVGFRSLPLDLHVGIGTGSGSHG